MKAVLKPRAQPKQSRAQIKPNSRTKVLHLDEVGDWDEKKHIYIGKGHAVQS